MSLCVYKKEFAFKLNDNTNLFTEFCEYLLIAKECISILKSSILHPIRDFPFPIISQSSNYFSMSADCKNYNTEYGRKFAKYKSRSL